MSCKQIKGSWQENSHGINTASFNTNTASTQYQHSNIIKGISHHQRHITSSEAARDNSPRSYEGCPAHRAGDHHNTYQHNTWPAHTSTACKHTRTQKHSSHEHA